MKATPAPSEIDHAFIERLVEDFYRRIRADERLAGIFSSEIDDDSWPAHLSRMKLFWRSVALKEAVYSGRPMQSHQKISGAEPKDFERWLDHFESSLRDLSEHSDTVDHMLSRARRIAASLQIAMFSRSRGGDAPNLA